MNYEELYGDLQPLEKKLKEMTGAGQRLYKAVVKDTENGDLKDLNKSLASLSELTEGLSALLKSIQETVDGFDSREYFQSGQFAGQLLEACKEKGVDVAGEYPVFEMFPYKVRLDAENQEIYLDRKRIQCMRPQNFAQTVKNGQDKLNKASFNAESFVNELVEAYDLAVLKAGRESSADVYLNNVYKLMVPMSRSRKEYDQQSFAYDLARLYGAGDVKTKDGRSFQFGPSRKGGKAIRILDKAGNEQFLAMIRFFHAE